MSEPFLSQIALFSFGFAPKSWALCNGQLLPINQNQALFALLGTTFGGDGKVSFALPDLRGRVPMGVGGTHVLGEAAGSETVVLTAAEMPPHTHALDVGSLSATANGRNAAANLPTPVGTAAAIENPPLTQLYSSQAPNATMSTAAAVVGGSATAADTGAGQSHQNRQPYVTLVYCIALAGIFPSQS
jgi:microcystin-dependent protein